MLDSFLTYNVRVKRYLSVSLLESKDFVDKLVEGGRSCIGLYDLFVRNAGEQEVKSLCHALTLSSTDMLESIAVQHNGYGGTKMRGLP